jgi:hypothetical protein
MLPISGQPFSYLLNLATDLAFILRYKASIKRHAPSELNLLVIRYSNVLQGA